MLLYSAAYHQSVSTCGRWTLVVVNFCVLSYWLSGRRIVDIFSIKIQQSKRVQGRSPPGHCVEGASIEFLKRLVHTPQASLNGRYLLQRPAHLTVEHRDAAK